MSPVTLLLGWCVAGSPIGGIAQTQELLEARSSRRKTMEIKRSGSQPSTKGPAQWFTGTVRIDPLFSPPDPARAAGALMAFEPGARTAWHTHPLGQTLIVTSVDWLEHVTDEQCGG